MEHISTHPYVEMEEEMEHISTHQYTSVHISRQCSLCPRSSFIVLVRQAHLVFRVLLDSLSVCHLGARLGFVRFALDTSAGMGKGKGREGLMIFS